MKSLLTVIRQAFLLIAPLLLATACISDNVVTDNCVAPESGTVKITFTLGTMGQTATRATTWDENEQQYASTNATAEENKIDPGRLQVLLYATDGTLIGKVTQLSHVQDATATNLYHFTGNVAFAADRLTDDKLSAKIVVLANAADYEPVAGSTLADMGTALTYNRTDTGDGIPMWGVKEVSALTLTPGQLNDIGTIHLLRAMAKITVTVARDADTANITSVSLNRYNKGGYVAPKDAAAYSDTKDISISGCFNPLAGEETSALPFTPSADRKTWTLYVPEFENSADRQALINVETKTLGVKPIYLKNYDTATGEPATGDNPDKDLIRNTVYQYNIRAIAEKKLFIQLSIADWEQAESEIGWDVTAGNDAVMYAWRADKTESAVKGDASAGDAEAVYCYVNYPRYNNSKHTTLIPGKASSAGFYFKMTQPKGAIWRAVLSNTDDFKFSNWKESESAAAELTWKENAEEMALTGHSDADGTNAHYCAETGIARDLPYQIRVEPTRQWFEAADATDFTGTTTADGLAYEQRYPLLGTNRIHVNGPHTDLSIEVSLDGEHYYKVRINPVISDPKVKGILYQSGRRFAGNNDYYIRIWHLRAYNGLTLPEQARSIPENDFK